MKQMKRLNRQLQYQGHVVGFYKDTMQFPNGNVEEWDFLKHKGAAAVVALTDNGEILMVRQMRASIDQEILEIPAGGLEPDEDMQTCALRELEEETGYRASESEHLLDIYTVPAYCNEKIGIYMAWGLTKTIQNLDENEFVTVAAYSLDQLTEMILNGTIQDAKTIAALMAYRAKLSKK